jgi:hypothetical protein
MEATMAVGELIVHNGRLSGTRRSLRAPLTILGRAPSCEIRLNVPEVEALHCLIVQGPAGALLRDLQSSTGTFVNGERVDTHLLQDGDLLEVGPFRFQLHLPPAQEAAEEEWGDARRVQVAAVAAQQAALDEEEFRLEQCRTDLRQQEVQLAAHLEEKRRQLEQESDEILAERERWLREKADTARRQDNEADELTQARDDLARGQQQLLDERERLSRMFQRLRQRWQKRRSADKMKAEQEASRLRQEGAALAQKLAEAERREEILARDMDHLQAERAAGNRQVREAQAALRAAQARWRRRRDSERAALRLQRQEATLLEEKLQRTRALVVQEKQAWEAEQRRLAQELYGLNNRVLNQRQTLQEQQEVLSRRSPQQEGPRQHIVAPPLLAERAYLERLAGELADQRLLLVEQWERVVRAQEAWQEQRDGAAAELERLAQELLDPLPAPRLPFGRAA